MTSTTEPAEKLSTREAWLKLAEACEHSLPCDCGCGRMTMYPRATGLCCAISILLFRGHIDGQQERAMLAKLPPRKPAWSWPTDADGMKARAKFCREQAKSCKE